MIHTTQAGFCWEIDPAFARILAEVLSAPGRVVKESPVKRVSVHSAEGVDYYVKRYRHSQVLFRPLKFYFKPSQARQEWQLAQVLVSRHIPVVKHVAHGERWNWSGLQESVLITEGFSGKPLDEAPRVDPKAVLDLVGQMHAQGVLQQDLHPGNILVSNDGLHICLVDIHGTIVKDKLGDEQRKQNLAFLRIFVRLPVPEPVALLSERMRRDYYWRRSQRCYRHNREFFPRKYGRLVWQVRLPWLSPQAEAVMQDPDGFLAHRCHLLKPGRSSTVGQQSGLVLKRFNLRKITSVFKDLFRRSRAQRAFRKAYHLELAGLRTARPVAAADWRRGWILYRSYYLMEEIPGAVDLRQWSGGNRAVIGEVALLLARLHEEGFTHRDLKETNIVIDQDAKPALLDLEGLSYQGVISVQRAAADLARLARGVAGLPQYAWTDRICFLHHYCKARKIRPRQLRDALGNLRVKR
jgi:tRNA A-37 threonylcarbamoyl transferase component Bud32